MSEHPQGVEDDGDESVDCQHPNLEYDPGNYVAPYGWEQMPGHWCPDCDQRVDVEDERDPDFENKYQKENW